MKRFVILFALLCAGTLGGVFAAQGHPVEPSGAGTETVSTLQHEGLAAIGFGGIEIAVETATPVYAGVAVTPVSRDSPVSVFPTPAFYAYGLDGTGQRLIC
jgi:hypothetical protein